MKTIAFIPVRGGSKSIPGKNIRRLGGRPLLHWTLDAATRSELIERVYVSSDSDEILRCAKEFSNPKVEAVVRPAEFATDTASTEAAVLDFAEQTEFDKMVLIQATSPLTTSADLDGALRKMEELSADSLLSVTHEHRFRWTKRADGLVDAGNYDPMHRPRRQDWDGELMENGAFYITSRHALLRSRCRLSGSVASWTMGGKTAVEIDTPEDWEILEALVSTTRGLRKIPRDVRLLVSDVDGVMTDAGMYYGPEGEALKKFSTRDGMGMRFWREAGREVAIVTGEKSEAVTRRAEKLGISEVHLGAADKLPVVRRIAVTRGLSLDQVAYVGDDLNDLAAIQAVGFSACPADAAPEIQRVVDYVCARRGGEGCVREVIDLLLASRD